MSPQIVVILLFLSMLFGLVIRFRLKEKQLEQQHMEHILVLENAISLNQGQMGIRNKGLGRYDFLKYNLDESLVVQEDISISKTYGNE